MRTSIVAITLAGIASSPAEAASPLLTLAALNQPAQAIIPIALPPEIGQVEQSMIWWIANNEVTAFNFTIFLRYSYALIQEVVRLKIVGSPAASAAADIVLTYAERAAGQVYAAVEMGTVTVAKGISSDFIILFTFEGFEMWGPGTNPLQIEDVALIRDGFGGGALDWLFPDADSDEPSNTCCGRNDDLLPAVLDSAFDAAGCVWKPQPRADGTYGGLPMIDGVYSGIIEWVDYAGNDRSLISYYIVEDGMATAAMSFGDVPANCATQTDGVLLQMVAHLPGEVPRD